MSARNDRTGEHARSRAAWEKIRALDDEIRAYRGDENGLRGLKHLQGDLVRVHGQPPSGSRLVSAKQPAEIAAAPSSAPPPPLTEDEQLAALRAENEQLRAQLAGT